MHEDAYAEPAGDVKPSGQGLQLSEKPPAEKNPAEHATHDAAVTPPVLRDPALQGKSATQLVEDEEPVEVVVYPAGHLMHCKPAGRPAGAYAPRGQSAHAADVASPLLTLKEPAPQEYMALHALEADEPAGEVEPDAHDVQN